MFLANPDLIDQFNSCNADTVDPNALSHLTAPLKDSISQLAIDGFAVRLIGTRTRMIDIYNRDMKSSLIDTLDMFLETANERQLSLKNGTTIKNLLLAIRSIDPNYKVPVHTAELVRENFKADLVNHVSCFSLKLVEDYMAVSSGFDIPFNGAFKRKMAAVILAAVKCDIETAYSPFLYAYINNSKAAVETLGVKITKTHKRDISDHLQNRLESDAAGGKNADRIDVVVADIRHILNQFDIAFDEDRKPRFFAAMKTGGIKALDNDFSLAATESITTASIRAMSIVNVSSADMAVTKISLVAAEEKAKIRRYAAERIAEWCTPKL